MRKRVALSYSASVGFFVNLPTYQIIPGTFLPVTPGVIDKDGVVRAPGSVAAALALNPTVEVELPDDTPVDKVGQVDAGALRAMYAEHPVCGVDGYVPPKLSKP